MNKNDSIFVAGHKGLVGSAIIRALKAQGYNNIITRNRQQCDLTSPLHVKQLFETTPIDYVFDAAGKKNTFLNGLFTIEMHSSLC